MSTVFYVSQNLPEPLRLLGEIGGGVSTLWGLISYVLLSLGLYTIAERRGIHHAWMAWVPILRVWVIGCISDHYRYIARAETKNRRTALLIEKILTTVCSGALIVIGVYLFTAGLIDILRGVPFVFTKQTALLAEIFCTVALIRFVLSVAYTILLYMCYYDLYTAAIPEDSVLLLVLSIIFYSFVVPVFVFAFRNQNGGMPPRYGEGIPGQPNWNDGNPIE